MDDLYKELGLSPTATSEEIRRAFRVLARRYHPDVNPGLNSSDKFKRISAAYETLGNVEKRRRYDQGFRASGAKGHETKKDSKAGYRSYQNAAEQNSYKSGYKQHSDQRGTGTTFKQEDSKKTEFYDYIKSDISIDRLNLGLGNIFQKIKPKVSKTLTNPYSVLKGVASKVFKGPNHGPSLASIAVVEVSISIFEAISGVKKNIELTDGPKGRKISVEIPTGMRTGSVLRLKAKGEQREELIVIVRVSHHPFLSIENKGLIMDVPVTITEAICGCTISLPTPDGTATVRIQPGSQSGSEIRIMNRGALKRDGSRGDLFCRLLIKVPESSQAMGLNEIALELSKYYSESPRNELGADIFSKDQN